MPAFASSPMRLDAPAASAPAARLPVIDAARGVAIVAMAIYHFAWDLRFFGLIAADVSTALGWRLFAHAIAGSFLALVGISLVLATRRGIVWPAFGRRLAVIAAAAALVSIATRIAFPGEWIFFGILHEIAVASVLGLAFVRLPWWAALAAAVAVFAAPVLLASPAFDRPLLWWTGLLTVYPATNDFVPVLPWFGCTLLGIALARLALPRGEAMLARWQARGAPSRALVSGGRHSLAIYLLHQPILFSLAYGLSLVVPPAATTPTAFRESCVAGCVGNGVAAARCQAICACTVDGLRDTPLWPSVLANRMDAAGSATASALARRCVAQHPN